MKSKYFLCLCLGSLVFGKIAAQTNAPSIQSGVTFQWSDTQTNKNQSATIKSVTVNGIVYLNFGLPTAYDLTQLGPDGHGQNKILKNGTNVETTSASTSWNASALTAFQDLNLNHYFSSSNNGRNICDNYSAESSTMAQRQTLSYGTGILATSSGVIAVTERNANNCLHIELFGIPEGGGAEQSLGETFVNQTSTKWGFGGTGSSGNLGTVGAINPPPSGTDYWLSDRVVENGGTIGIALFYLDDIAPNGSLITKAQLTASTSDHADGKMFIFTLADEDQDGLSDVDDLDDDNDGIKDTSESNGINPSADDDTDGIPNYKDPDFCTLNSFGVCANLDFDSDGIPNHFDLDSDNDGITDVIESGGTDSDNDGFADGTISTTVLTYGIPSSAGTGTNPINTDNKEDYDFLDIDSDNDGIPDNVESQTTLGYVVPTGTINAITGIDAAYGNGIIPVDTDYDNVPDFLDLDSDNDGYNDIQENGMADTYTAADVDGDGLSNAFETNGVNDTVLDINEDIENPSDLTILPDADGDLFSGGDLDYRDVFSTNPPSSATIDFDGVDDYLDSDLNLGGYTSATIMAWIKLDAGFSGSGQVISFGNLYIEVQNSKELRFKVNDATVAPTAEVDKDVWTHVALIFDSASSSAKLKTYINGELHGSSNDASLVSGIYPSSDSFTIGARSQDHALLFHGAIDEVRVFSAALTEDQMRKIVYQEINNNSGNVHGSTVPKPVSDSTTSAVVSWGDLKAYYPMTDIVNLTTTDFSGNGLLARLHNITTVQPQTAPMPYITRDDGCWCSESTWLHGDVWDIETAPGNKAWSIVQISHNVSTTHSHSHLGLIIDANKTLTVTGDNLVENSWYLELNGTLDLMGDSQLLQTENSDLVTSAQGKILRRQEGQANPYRYNYWASPVGATAESSLSDNNSGNNVNNTAFSLNMLKDGSGSGCLFTSGQTGNGKISTQWLYTFMNGLTYWDWAQVSPSTAINPGVGYTQKGTGNSGSEQQYIFEGKPNNGTILLAVKDRGGAGSEPNKTKTDYLLGNPYASALDIHKFIEDNAGVIDGTLHLWQQWGGNSHYLNEYQGGYAQVNKLGSCRAYQFVGFYGDHNGSQDGTIVPTRYLPVGQGFVAEIVADGNVEFNNGQRAFIKESDADGTYYNGSAFSKSSDGKKSKQQASRDTMQKIRLDFSSVTGPKTRRELLMGFSDYTSDDFDYGYDAKGTETNNNDLSLSLEGKNMVMQAYGEITDDKVVPLNLKSSGNNTFEIKISEKENLKESQRIYLRDNLTGEYFELTKGGAYRFSSEAGMFKTRLEIVFKSEQQLLGTEEILGVDNQIYYQNAIKTFYAKNMDSEVTHFSVVNMRGQSVQDLNDVSNAQLEMGILLNNLATGAYVVCLRTASNEVLTKKIVVN